MSENMYDVWDNADRHEIRQQFAEREKERIQGWLMPGAVVPVDVATTAALVNEIKRLIEVVGGMALKIADEREEYERGFIDGMQEQLRRIVDKRMKEKT